MMKGIEEAMRDRVAGHDGAVEVFAAREGLELQVHGRGITSTVAEASALRRRSIAGRHVMIVTADELQAVAITRVLGEDDLSSTRIPNRGARACAPGWCGR